LSSSSIEAGETGTVEVTMPDTGTGQGAAVVAWLKQPGEGVEADEPICVVAWDDNTGEVTSPATGVLRMLAVAPGDEVATGTSLAVVDVGVRAPRRPPTPPPPRPETLPRGFEPVGSAPPPAEQPLEPVPVGFEPEPVEFELEPVQAEAAEPEPAPDEPQHEPGEAEDEPPAPPAAPEPFAQPTAFEAPPAEPEAEPDMDPIELVGFEPEPDLEPVAFEPSPPVVEEETPVAPTIEDGDEPEPERPEPEPEPEIELVAVPEDLLREAPIGDPEPVDLGGFLSPAVRRFAREHGVDPDEVEGTGMGGRVTLRDIAQ
jgi:2-oxoglutarate dehydrogenase E2 component (dihydrolipoamide succinyltransferase)